MPNVVTAFIGMGANLNHPVRQIEKGIKGLNLCPDILVDAISPLYSSQPVGPQDQPDFVNCVVKITTRLSAQNLLLTLQTIENNQGRQRLQDWGPRIIDLDILLYGDHVINESNLVVPHEEMQNRGFVLLPLLDLAPDLTIPTLGTLTSLIETCPHMLLNKMANEINIETLILADTENAI